MDLLGSVPHLISSPLLLDTFMKLPHAWVRWWAASEQLATDSENSLVLLLISWTQCEQGQECSDEELDELLKQVRMCQLSTSYMHSLLPCVLHGNTLRGAYARFRALHSAPHDFEDDWEPRAQGVPKAWLSAAGRPHPNGDTPQLPLHFVMNVPEAKMREMLECCLGDDNSKEYDQGKDSELWATAQFYQGWHVAAWLALRKATGGAGSRLASYIKVIPKLPGENYKSIVDSSSHKSMWSAVATATFACDRVDATKHKVWFSVNFMPLDSGLGFGDFLAQPTTASSMSEDWGEYLVGGEFRFTVTVDKLL